MTCRQGAGGSGIQELTTDTERIMYALDYQNYIDTYQTGRTFRAAGSTGTLNNWIGSNDTHARAARFYEFFKDTQQDVYPAVMNLSQPTDNSIQMRVNVNNATASQIGTD